MSSFRRAGATQQAGEPLVAAGVKAKGVKPATTGGLGLVSSGNKELDGLLGGGLALGTSVVISVDKLTNFGEVLMQYSMAERARACATRC